MLWQDVVRPELKLRVTRQTRLKYLLIVANEIEVLSLFRRQRIILLACQRDKLFGLRHYVGADINCSAIWQREFRSGLVESLGLFDISNQLLVVALDSFRRYFGTAMPFRFQLPGQQCCR